MADTYLSEVFAKITAEASPAQFRDAAERAVKAGLDGVSAQVTMELGTDKARRQAADLKEQLKTLVGEVTSTVKLDDAKARLQLATFAASADRLNRKLGKEKISLDGVARASLDLLRLQVQADRLRGTLADEKVGGLQGLIGKLFGLGGSAGSGGGMPFLPPGAGGAAGGAALGVAGAAAAGALLVEVTGLVSGFAAAGLGAGAFGALAIPTFKRVSAALTAISTAQQAYAKAAEKQKLDPTKQNAKAVASALLALKVAQQGQPKMILQIVSGIHGLETEFGRLAKVMQPDILKVFNAGLKVAATVLPDLLPLAQAAAGPIASLFGSMAKFFQTSTKTTVWEGAGRSLHAVTVTTLTPFGKWLQQITALVGPSTTAIGAGVGKVAVALGKLLTIMSKKDVVNAINIAFTIVADTIGALGWTIKQVMKSWDLGSAAFVRDWHHIRAAAIDVWHAIDQVVHNIEHAYANWQHAGGNLSHAVSVTVADVTAWFQALPGRIEHALGDGLTTAYDWGKNVIFGIGRGAASVWHDVLHFFAGLSHDILHALGIASPPAWAIEAGRHIMGGIGIGISEARPAVARAVASLAATVSGALAPGASGVEAMMKRMAAARGWTGPQWTALRNVEMREAGFSLTATNPSSGAYGLAQFIGGPGEYALYGGNAATAAGQITGMLNYIAQRYGTPAGAWNSELTRGWYAKGADMVVSRPTLIGVGEAGPERVIIAPAAQAARRSGAAGPQKIVLEVRANSHSYSNFLASEIKKYVHVVGAGSVQVAYGSAL